MSLWYIGGWMLFPFLMIFGGFRAFFEMLEDKVSDIKHNWLVGCRRVMGFTDDGKSPERVAELEARRQKVLAELREGIAATKARKTNQNV
jgi:hypothetical protein